MRDNLNGDIWGTIAKDPELQRAILDSLRESEEKYRILTGDITKYVDLAPDEATRRRRQNLIDKISEIRIGQIIKAQSFIRQGAAPEDPIEKMLVDMDINAFVIYMLLCMVNKALDMTREAGANAD